MRNSLTLFGGFFILLFVNVANAQPSNDDPCAADNLTLGIPVMGSCSGATVLPGEVSPPGMGDCATDWCDGSLDGSVWYTFVAPASGNIVITSCTVNNMADTQFALWDVGDCLDFMTYMLIAANDDKTNCSNGGSSYASEISFCGLSAGVTYYLQVDGFFGDPSNFEIIATDPGVCPNYCHIQFVHSSPDLSIPSVDIRIDGVLVADNLNYGEATDFVLVNNILNPNITINPSTSTDDMSAYYSLTVPLDQQVYYVVPVVGIYDIPNYYVDESGAYLGFTGMEVTTAPNNPNLSQITFVNAVTDVQGLRFYFDGVDAFPGGMYYGEIRQDEYTLPINIPFEVYDINNASHYGRFHIPFDQYTGQNITIITSGFVDPTINNNGPGLSMCVVKQDGTVDCFMDELSVGDFADGNGLMLFPNPAKDLVNVRINLNDAPENCTVQVCDVTGKVVLNKAVSSLDQNLEISVLELQSGTYYVKIIGNNYSSIPEALVVGH